MLRRIRSHMTYANTTATLALFLALGGVSWAATSLPPGSVGTRQIKNSAVTLVKVSPGARRALHGATGRRGVTGPRGPAGHPGAAAAKYFAFVASDGTLKRGSPGVTSAYDSGAINYEVTFPVSVAGCVAEVTPANYPVGGGGSGPSQVLVSAAIGNEYNSLTSPDTVRVTLGAPTGSGINPAQEPFYLAVLC